MLDFTKPFVVEIDALGIVLEVVLMQKECLISYIIRVFSNRNRLKSVYEKELTNIVFAVHKWHHYLSKTHFIIRTNQKV